MIENIRKKYTKLPLGIKASIWFLICSFMQKGISVITTPIFTRLLNASEYGSYNIFLSWESIFTVLITMNLFYGMYSRGLVKYEEDKKRFTSSIAGLLSVLVLFWSIIYIVFRNPINNIIGMKTEYMLLMLLWIWVSSIFQMWAAEQRVDYKYKKLVIISIAVSIFSPLLSIILILKMKDKVLGRILGMIIVSIFAYFWMFCSQLKKGKKFYIKKYWTHAFKFCIPLIPHYFSQTILNSSDRIMIDKMVDAKTAGIYSLAYSISMIMILFNNALSQTISPWIYKKIKNNKITEISDVAYFTLYIIAFVNILLILFAPEAIALFAPEEYREAIWIIPPVAMSVYFIYAYDLFSKFEFYFEKTKLISLATIIGAVFNLITNYIFINIFGYIAAGYTTLFCYILYAIFHYIFMVKVCKEKCNNVQPYDTKKILKITILFLSLGFLILFLYNFNIARYIFIVIIIIICFVKRKYIIESLKKILLVRKKES